MDKEELIKWYEKLPQCYFCKLTIWPDAQEEILDYNEGLSHKYCIEKAEEIRFRELLSNPVSLQ